MLHKLCEYAMLYVSIQYVEAVTRGGYLVDGSKEAKESFKSENLLDETSTSVEASVPKPPSQPPPASAFAELAGMRCIVYIFSICTYVHTCANWTLIDCYCSYHCSKCCMEANV